MSDGGYVLSSSMKTTVDRLKANIASHDGFWLLNRLFLASISPDDSIIDWDRGVSRERVAQLLALETNQSKALNKTRPRLRYRGN